MTMSAIELSQLFLLFGAGIIAGIINVAAGGGSMLTMPLMIFMGLPGAVANGTNRIALLCQNIVACYSFFKNGWSHFKLSISLALCTIPGAIIGALLGTELNGLWFNRTLALVMLVAMLLMLTGKRRSNQQPSEDSQPKRILLTHLLMLGIGFYGGFIQVGVGLLLMPILHRCMGLPLMEVNMHKVFIVLVYTSVALFIFASKIQIAWTIGLCLAAGNALGGWIGARLSISKKELWIQTILYVVSSLFIVKLLLS